MPGVAYLLALATLTALFYNHGLWLDWLPPARVWQPVLLYVLALVATAIVVADTVSANSYLSILGKNLAFVAIILLAVRSFEDHRSLLWAMLLARRWRRPSRRSRPLPAPAMNFSGMGHIWSSRWCMTQRRPWPGPVVQWVIQTSSR
ncbi:MAG: hypothetical protein R2849_19385 [Thermomicrobiales bacterium]